MIALELVTKLLIINYKIGKEIQAILIILK